MAHFLCLSLGENLGFVLRLTKENKTEVKKKEEKGMKTAKVGAIFLISVLALAGIGVGYSAWTDTIYVQGIVNTGTVGWHFSDYSGTWVYKDLIEEDEIIVTTPYPDPDGDGYVDTNGDQIDDALLISWAFAEQAADDHHAIVEFANLFPCIDFIADVEITYTGSVPGKLNLIGFTDSWASDPNEESYDDEVLIDQYTTIEITVYDDEGTIIYQGVPELGLQLHQDYSIYAVMKIHLPQVDNLMNLYGDFGVFAEIVQWNEYPYP
jgi:hypothetical protein